MFLITTGKTRLGLRRKIVLKLKSNEVIDKTSGGPRAMTCNPALIPHQIFSSLPSQGEVEWGDLFTRLFAWYLMSIIGTPRLGTTVTTDPASQPAWRQWELRFRKLAASPSHRLGEIREISCVIRESWEEAGEEAGEETGGQQKYFHFPVWWFPLQQHQDARLR